MAKRHMNMPKIIVYTIFVASVYSPASSQTVRLDGSPTCFRALEEISKEHAKTQKGVSFRIGLGGSYLALEELGQGKVDIAYVEYPLLPMVDKAWDQAFPKGKKPAAEYVFAQTALGIVVNKNNALSKLTCDQLRNIWSGKVTTWKTVGGSGGQIKLFSIPPSRRLAGCLMSNLVIDYRKWPKDCVKLSSNENVIASVAADPNGMGFVALTPDLPKEVKLIAIAKDAKGLAVEPTVDNIVLEKYSLVQQYKLVLTKNSSPAAKDFAQFACSEAAAKIVKEWGLFPVAIKNKAESDKRLAEYKSGKGVRVYAIGCGGAKDVMPDLAVEYVRAKQVAQLSYAEVDSDLAAVAGFVSGGSTSLTAGGKTKHELLILDGKPSVKTLDVHGKKWNALGPDGTGPTEYIMAGRAVAIVVNPTNKLDSLTLGQVQAIFRGDTDNWTTVGNTGLDAAAGDKKSDLRINLFGLRPGDAATAVFEKECLPRGKWKGVTSKKDTAEVLKAVSLDPLAIGFVDLGAIQAGGTASSGGSAAASQNAKVLAIQVGTKTGTTGETPVPHTVKPTAENIKNAMYPLSQRLYLYVHPNASETAKDFAKFLATCGGSDAGPYVDTVKAMMDTYAKHGLMPLSDAALERQAKDALAEAEKTAEKKP